MIPAQQFDVHFHGKIAEIRSVTIVKDHVAKDKTIDVIVRKDMHILVAGPNGIGKSTLLHAIAMNESAHVTIPPDVVIGYYQQDFGNLDGEQTAFDALKEVMVKFDEQKLRSTAAGFLLDGALLASAIKSMSEGQKGLLSFCRLVLLQPGLLILDEPTNHINFRHLPVLAEALDKFQGAMIMVSHIPDFVLKVRIDEIVDLEK